MLVCSGNPGVPFRALGLVTGFASVAEGCSGTINIGGAYTRAVATMESAAQAMGANAIVYVGFQLEKSTAAGCTGPKSALEVFAYGTAAMV